MRFHGRDLTFVWDSSEVPDAPGVELRILVSDADPGTGAQSTAAKPYETDFELEFGRVSAPYGHSIGTAISTASQLAQ